MKLKILQLLVFLPFILAQAAETPAPPSVPPVIDVWYGDEQHFGRLGVPQKWVNILGRVSPGDNLKTFYYSLNNGTPVPLKTGADGKRLAREGDFNVDLEFDSLRKGTNIVNLTAIDTSGNRTERSVKVHCHHGNVWPLPYHVEWSKVGAINEVAQIVDGRWKLEPEGLRVAEPYYDRILAFGDRTWTDYTVTVSVTIHSYAPPRKAAPTYGVSHVAIAARFPGHFDDNKQPHVQWYPLGAVAEFRLAENLDQSSWRIFRDGAAKTFPKTLIETRTRRVELGVRYRLKLQVDSLPGSASRYRVRAWKDGESEPGSWDMDTTESGAVILGGGVLIVAHNTDATFGELTVTPNAPEE